MRIQTDLQTIGTIEANLWGDVDDYCAFCAQNLSSVMPTAGAAEHDGRIVGQLKAALSSFHSLVQTDADQVRGIHTTMQKADEAIARGLASGGAS